MKTKRKRQTKGSVAKKSKLKVGDLVRAAAAWPEGSQRLGFEDGLLEKIGIVLQDTTTSAQRNCVIMIDGKVFESCKEDWRVIG